MTIKTKNILLIIGFIISLYFCYQLAISKTIDLKNEYAHLKTEQRFFKNTPKQLSLLLQKQKYYDSLLNTYQVNGTSIQNNLLKTINILADSNHLKVIKFLEPHKIKNNDLTIKTYQFTIEGSYNSILKAIFHLEQKTKFGEIINLHLEKKTNFKSGKKYLQASVLLRSFE